MADKANEVAVNDSKDINGFTITAIVLASVGFLINPFSTLSTLGIVFSAVGLAKSRSSKDKTWAIIMLSLSIVETLFWFAVMANTMAAL